MSNVTSATIRVSASRRVHIQGLRTEKTRGSRTNSATVGQGEPDGSFTFFSALF